MFAAPPEVRAEVVARLPEALRRPPLTAFGRLWAGGGDGSFLEGPAFDRAGTLWLADIAHGRLLCLSAAGQFTVAAEYDGEPNGLAIHRDGRVFVADRRRGLLALDPRAPRPEPVIEGPALERFKGVNDLVFAGNGDLYFTDQGQTGLHDPSGRLYRLRPGQGPEVLLAGVPSPNGVALSPDEQTLYLAVTRANSVWRVPLGPEGAVGRVGVFIQLSGGLAGPDGLAVDQAGNLAVAHAGLGTVWLFDPLGEPLRRIRSPEGLMTTNVAYGGPDGRTLHIVESATGTVLRARLDVPGLPTFGQSP
jgi:gluconolactonase